MRDADRKYIRHTINWPSDVRRRDLRAWTAPRTVRCGDIGALYEVAGEGHAARWVAVGRHVTDAVKGADDNYWGWINWLGLKEPIPYASATVASVQRSYGKLGPDSESRKLLRRLVRDDSIALRILNRWLNDEAGYPPSIAVPIHELLKARLAPPDHERTLYPIVERALLTRSWSEVDGDLRRVLTTLTGATPTDRAANRRRIPDVFVCKPRLKRLLLVEVKKGYARRARESDYDPVDQVLSYMRATERALARERLRGWTINCAIVAEDFDPAVLLHAARKEVAAAHVDADSESLRFVRISGV